MHKTLEIVTEICSASLIQQFDRWVTARKENMINQVSYIEKNDRIANAILDGQPYWLLAADNDYYSLIHSWFNSNLHRLAQINHQKGKGMNKSTFVLWLIIVIVIVALMYLPAKAQEYKEPYLSSQGQKWLNENDIQVLNNVYYVVCDKTDLDKFIKILIRWDNGKNELIERQYCGFYIYIHAASLETANYVSMSDTRTMSESEVFYQNFLPLITGE